MVSLALGNFDGVHLAHAAVLHAAAAYDNSICLLFQKHPLEVIAGAAPPRLLSPEHLEKKILACGIQRIAYLDFAQVRALTPEQFFEQILMERFHAEVICCGYNYSFGKDRAGDVACLERLCRQHGVQLCVAEEKDFEGASISATRIRRCIEGGAVEKANAMLGYPFFYEAAVARGKQLGRELGFPTINQYFGAGCVKPRAGVYASRVTVEGKTYAALTNIGDNPTISGDSFRSESYLFDFDKQVYGKPATVELLRFIREEKKFKSTQALRAQVLRDIERAKHV